jgi:hypothetical protein
MRRLLDLYDRLVWGPLTRRYNRRHPAPKEYR